MSGKRPIASAYSLEADDDGDCNVTQTQVSSTSNTNRQQSQRGSAASSSAAPASASAISAAMRAGGSRPKNPKQKNKRAVSFRKDLKSVMYGFGDEWNPLAESVDFMDQVVKEYIQGMTAETVRVASEIGKLDEKCLIYALRNDGRKTRRIFDLLAMYKEVVEARSQKLHKENHWFKEANKPKRARTQLP